MLLSHRLRAAGATRAGEPPIACELVRWAGPELADMASLFGCCLSGVPGAPAYRVDGTWITYADCGARVSRIAASLRDRLEPYRQATGKQPTIAVLLPNSQQVLEFFFTAALAHSILYPLNHRLSATEIEAGLRAGGATILLTSDAFAQTLTEIDWGTLAVQTIIWTSAPVDLPVDEYRSWDSLLSESGSTLTVSHPSRALFLLARIRYVGNHRTNQDGPALPSQCLCPFLRDPLGARAECR